MISAVLLENTQKKFRDFAISDRHASGIIFFRRLLKKPSYRQIVRIQLDLAFLLYHEALKSYLNRDLSVAAKRPAMNQLREAIKICHSIIKSEQRDVNEKEIINARIFLAQIYACMRNPAAINLARKTFERASYAVTANRLADVYVRLDRPVEAKIWYKKYEKLANQEKIPSYLIATDMAIFYKDIGKNDLANRYLEQALANLPHSKKGKSVLSIIKRHFVIKKGGLTGAIRTK
ncbi:hypothetical protein A2631_01480 [Candidatus Daviesbacteria bacterium RIFCSPHIGHO2_01_FULL_44_29]|nr:MAG: hypothetical protein A2631_01480 [Candidatus Daviesbacteria bacterium RIFCSPHIGHO2_01_FULL_44_29]OGE69927.1 MAG: hypothetical protein A3B55_00045 [Candidatus Daviesbacteria bacterium RIFCSPLOWO2_01_FULL_43_15]